MQSEVAVCTAGTDSQSAARGVTLSEGIQQAGATDSLQGFGSGVANTDLSGTVRFVLSERVNQKGFFLKISLKFFFFYY